MISDHIEKGGSVLSYPEEISTSTITSESSGAVVFMEPLYVFVDADGQDRPWDHLKQLDEALHRVTRAFVKAKGSSD